MEKKIVLDPIFVSLTIKPFYNIKNAANQVTLP